MQQSITGAVSAVPIAAAKRNNREPFPHSTVKPKCLLWYEKIRDHPKRRGGESDVCAKVYGYLRDDTNNNNNNNNNMTTLAKIFGKFHKKHATKKLHHHHLMSQPPPLLLPPSSSQTQTNPRVEVVTTFVASRSDGVATLARLDDERVAAYRSQRPPPPAARASTPKDGRMKAVRTGSRLRPQSSDRRRSSSSSCKPQYTAVTEERIRKRRSKLGQPTRAQVFRNRFIRRKMLAMKKDKNDSWWNRFNVKLYYNDFYR